MLRRPTRGFNILNMIGQSKISSFFSPSQKRKCSDEQNTPPAKKQILDETSPEQKTQQMTQCSSPANDVQLSPEQQKRMEENRFKAKAKLYEKQTHGLLVNFGQSWFRALEPEFAKPYFIQLSKFVAEERQKKTIYPSPENVFSWTRACDIKDVKVVILGQDPYHGPRQAHGLSFSVLPGIQPPPSLLNMYKELEGDIEGFKRPNHGYLQGWAKQGVLMLNACLTVRAAEANSHKDKGWEKFTDATISWLNKNRQQIVFILWGSYAQKKGAHIDKVK